MLFIIALLVVFFGSCESKNANPRVKGNYSESSVIKYTEDGKVQKSSFTEDEKRQMRELKYTPPPSRHDAEYFRKNKISYMELLESHIGGKSQGNDQPLALVEDLYDTTRILTVVNQDGLVMVVNDKHGVTNPYNLEEPSIKKTSVSLFNGIKSQQSEMILSTYKVPKLKSRNYYYVTEEGLRVKTVPIIPAHDQEEIWKSISQKYREWQSAYRYSF